MEVPIFLWARGLSGRWPGFATRTGAIRANQFAEKPSFHNVHQETTNRMPHPQKASSLRVVLSGGGVRIVRTPQSSRYTLPPGLQRRCSTEGPEGHLMPVTLKPVICISRIFRFFVSAFPAFSAFAAFQLYGISSDPCFSGFEGLPAFSVFSPCRVRIADFENPTDWLSYDRPRVTGINMVCVGVVCRL